MVRSGNLVIEGLLKISCTILRLIQLDPSRSFSVGPHTTSRHAIYDILFVHLGMS